MPLKGQAKTDYQREYMRRQRGSNVRPTVVRPRAVRPVGKTHTFKMGFEPEPTGRADADGNLLPEGDL